MDKQTRNNDARKIAEWMLENVPCVESYLQGRAWAEIIVKSKTYDRTQPIENNRLSGFEFTVPAPATL